MENYKIIGRAGEGAHGCVYKGLDTRSDKTVAFKKICINTELGIPKNTIREMCALRALKSKHIVKLFEITSMGSSVVLIMEYLPCSLQEILKSTELTLPQTKSYSKMILKGIDFMHSNHIMHRDIKPANLLISPKKVLKIADFGLARIYHEQDPTRQYSHQVATRWYRAPELLYGSKTYSPSVDVWSVGCIIGEMINGTPLFPGETDIEQLAIVLSTLGTPSKESWPDLQQLPDYNKISFISSPGKPWKRIVPKADSSTMDLLQKIIIYDGCRRPTAKQCLSHQFFKENPRPARFEDMPEPIEHSGEVASFNPSDFDEIIQEINEV